jgi:hypothetical protein
MFALLLCGVTLMAQNTMRVHYKDGNVLDVTIAQMDSVTFVDKNAGDSEETVSLTASWLWGNVNQGYYEVITFSDDHTYTGYDNYFSYGFDSMTYGWWTQIGAMLTLQSNGFGYMRRYNWYITELTANALGVMTNMGPFTYYKVQPETLRLHVGESLTCQEGDSFLFADGVKVAIQDAKLAALSAGETYIQKLIAPTNTILSYKLIVE